MLGKFLILQIHLLSLDKKESKTSMYNLYFGYILHFWFVIFLLFEFFSSKEVQSDQIVLLEEKSVLFDNIMKTITLFK